MSDNEQNEKEVNYWRSFNELYKTTEFLKNSEGEFPPGVEDKFDVKDLSGISRRKFLALVGASAALAGAGCSDYRDKGHTIPYNKKPEEIVIGEPNYYASTCTGCSEACGILIKTREGRPIKVDGNPDHPVNQGKVCTKGHASIMNLYDPERLASPLKNSGGFFNKVSWKLVHNEILNLLEAEGIGEIALLTSKITSPTVMQLIKDFQSKYTTARHYSFELFNDAIRNSAWLKSGGTGNFPLIKWNEAKIILTLEGDILSTDSNSVETIRMYAEGRNVNDLERFNRLYSVESNFTVTGMNADYRLKLRPDAQLEFVNLLTEAVNGNASALMNFAKKHKMNQKSLGYLVKDLNQNRGKSIIYAGKVLPEAVHIAVNNLNRTLGNETLYRNDSREVNLHALSTNDELRDLVNRMNNGNISAIIHFDVNPVFNLPADFNYGKALAKVKTIITMTELENETSVLSTYVLPVNHAFESWGDSKTRTGFYSLQQPVIAPLQNTRQKEGVLVSLIQGNYHDNIYYEYLRKNWQNNVFSGADVSKTFDEFWNEGLHDGVVFTTKEETYAEPVQLNNNNTNLSSNDNYLLVLKESNTMGDGRYANNGWLQELPHPVSKITWDNYAAISVNTAKELGVDSNDLIEVDVNGHKLEIPAFVQPGAVDKVITIELGYGRTKTGTVGTNVGFNANKLISSTSALSPFLYQNVKSSKTGGTYKLISSQEHYAFDKGHTKDIHVKRDIIKEGTVNQYKQKPDFLHEHRGEKIESMYGNFTEKQFTGLKWGMAIDMNKCIGCGECVVGCNSENNVPVVGKDQVAKSREMQWIRIDRYYAGDYEDPKVSQQIMLCQHCDHAPCENVCPVSATTHSNDGLNQMAYNRCVGTRYCSNNCPYKVRRFNFFNFRDHFADSIQQNEMFNLIYNPEVTVRSRGVMEKCTFCIQRIVKSREDAKREGRLLSGNEVKTACQEACISEAITFGDMNDLESDVSKMRKHDLSYFVLEELNTRPNIAYIAKLRNTHPEEV